MDILDVPLCHLYQTNGLISMEVPLKTGLGLRVKLLGLSEMLYRTVCRFLSGCQLLNTWITAGILKNACNYVIG